MKDAVQDKSRIVLSQLRQMEVIDVAEGKRLGFIGDIIFDEDFTQIESLVIPSQSGFLSIFKRKDDINIKWNQIKVIGFDIILVDLSGKVSTENDQSADKDNTI